MSATQQGTKLYPGITKPLSLEGPTEYDIHLTKELQKTLMLYGLYDSEETAKLR
jgi:poly(A) polymerase